MGGASVVASGLKNSGEGCDFDRRVYTIAWLALTAIAAPTLAKTLLGRADLNFRASLRFAFIQGVIFGAVDFGSSFMEKADVIPPIVPEPEVDAPPPQQQNYIDAVPLDAMSVIFQCLSNADIAKAALTCKKFQEVVETPQIQMHLAEQFAFGPKDWNRYFGDIGEVPPLPPDIMDILRSPCPYWEEKSVANTHLLVLIPRTVNGSPFTLNLLGEMIKVPRGEGWRAEYRYRVKNRGCLAKIVDRGIPKHSWFLITKNVLPGSLNKTYYEQIELIRSPYEVPFTLEIATGVLMHHVRSGERLYPEWNVWGKENIRFRSSVSGLLLREGSDCRMMVGSFEHSVLSIGCPPQKLRHAHNGLAGVRRL